MSETDQPTYEFWKRGPYGDNRMALLITCTSQEAHELAHELTESGRRRGNVKHDEHVSANTVPRYKSKAEFDRLRELRRAQAREIFAKSWADGDVL